MAHSTNGRPPQLAHLQRNPLIQVEVFRCRHIPKCKRSNRKATVSLSDTRRMPPKATTTMAGRCGTPGHGARERPQATIKRPQLGPAQAHPLRSRCDTPGRRTRQVRKDHSRVTAKKGHSRTRVTFAKRRFQKYKPNSKISGKVQGATHCPVAGPSGKLNAHFAVPLSQEVPFGRSLINPIPCSPLVTT